VTGQTTIAASTATTSLNGSIVTALFAGALFLSAFLLFALEPMVAKSILPTLGGTPDVLRIRQFSRCLSRLRCGLLGAGGARSPPRDSCRR
jgi:hypothetical protein